MRSLSKRIFAFIVFRNVFISLAAVCLVAETRYLNSGSWLTIDALLVFTFFATFLVYNFHSFSNYLDENFSIQNIIRSLSNPNFSLEQRICVSIGLTGTLIAFAFLKVKMMVLLLPAGIITLAYTLPLFRHQKKQYRLREIIYVKIFTIAFMWTVATVLLPYVNESTSVSMTYEVLLFLERLLFIYAITIPFEIRDRHREMAKGIRTIPGVYGMEKSKRLGYLILLLYCIIVFIREFIFSHHDAVTAGHFIALALSAFSAALLIFKTTDNNHKWYFKFLIDGTMIEQFLLLILVQILC